MVRILVSGTLAALTVAAAQAPAINGNGGGRINMDGAGDLPTILIMLIAFVMAAAAQWLVSSVQIEKMSRYDRLIRAGLSGIVMLGFALLNVDTGITWSKLLALSVAVGLAGPSAVDVLMKKFGMDKPAPPPPADEDEEGGSK